MSRRLIVVPAIVLLVTVGAVAAYAHWTATGSGTSVGTVGSGPIVTVQAVASGNSPSSKLLPGTSGDLVVQIDNPNDYTVTIVGIVQSGPVMVVNGSSGCTSDSGSWPDIALGTSGVSAPTQTSGLSVYVSAGSTAVVTIPGGASMTSASANGCQGASFRVAVDLTVQP